MKKVLALLLLAVFAAALLAGCSAKGVYHVKTIDGEPPLEYFRALIEQGGMITFEDYLQRTGAEEKAFSDPITLELKEDNTYVLTTRVGKEQAPVTGTWKLESGTLTLYRENREPMTGSVRNGEITLTDVIEGQNVEIVYGKR